MPLNDKKSEYWHLLASHDMDTVSTLLKESGHPEIIVYHMHQAVEKLIKGEIIKVGGQFPYIHDIERLYKLLCEKTSSFKGLEREIIILQSLYGDTRYPQEAFLKPDDLDRAKSVFNLLIGSLKRKKP